MKLYVITQGVYSDKRVLGVVSSLEGYEGLLALEDTRAIPFELDAVQKVEPGYKLFEVTMDWEGDADVYGASWLPDSEGDDRVYTNDGGLCRIVAAMDKAHAVKIVNEERTRLLAQGINQ